MNKSPFVFIKHALPALLLTLTVGCWGSAINPSLLGLGADAQPQDLTLQQAQDELRAGLNSVSDPSDPDNVSLQAEISAKLDALTIQDKAVIMKLADYLTARIASENKPDTALSDLSELLSELALPGEPDNPAADNTATQGRIIVSDGLTKTGMQGSTNEILPHAVVYNIPASYNNSVVNFGLAIKESGIAVQFYYRRSYLGDMARWHKIGSPVTTDSGGTAALSSLAPLLDPSCFPGKYQTERDLDLKAVASVSKGTISDNLGRVRILGVDPGQNNATILTDHDNTLHKTGGTNSIEDIADSANVLLSKWPLIESSVQASVKGWIAGGHDLVIITGQTDPIRPKCREQVSLHFENSGERRILMINNSDVPVSGGANAFKAEAIKIIMGLYGKTNIKAMVGDTVSQDGYGALANDATYIPYHVYYYLNPLALDTQGYGKIDSKSVIWKWNLVIERIKAAMAGN